MFFLVFDTIRLYEKFENFFTDKQNDVKLYAVYGIKCQAVK
ncbi:hypothetical protein SpAn4DRAFT_2493 [Sporomusa ovata]|uniref:Uncharacterized protein n=1 Tax=Sporomusa ovata TaxID=2378 RepID=A0A0U1L0R8_9FIRM|nr:hypothetical protein SpAn4DRAFT_2493 [Sporomusa ovata]